MIILGIDPGLADTGWGVIEHEGPLTRCLAYGCVSTKPASPLPERLARVHEEIRAVVARYQPSAVAVESVYFGTNAKSAFATGQARGVALLAMADAVAEVAEYSPAQIKGVVVGEGGADKERVQYMVRLQLGLDHTPRPDHAADALAAALCHAQLRRSRQIESGVAR